MPAYFQYDTRRMQPASPNESTLPADANSRSAPKARHRFTSLTLAQTFHSTNQTDRTRAFHGFPYENRAEKVKIRRCHTLFVELREQRELDFVGILEGAA